MYLWAPRASSDLGYGRVAKSARTDEPGSSIAKDLIDSENPKHRLFCTEIAFDAIYTLIIFPSFDRNSNIFATAAESLKHICF